MSGCWPDPADALWPCPARQAGTMLVVERFEPGAPPVPGRLFVNMLRTIRTALPPRRGQGIPAPARSLAGPFPQPVRSLDRQPGGPGTASAPRAPCPHCSPTPAFRGSHPQESVHSP